MLTLYSARRDRALGLPRPGARTLNLLDYRRKQQHGAAIELTSAVFLKCVIDECRKETRQLIDGADTPEKRREILSEVERLNELAQKAATELEKMSHAG